MASPVKRAWAPAFARRGARPNPDKTQGDPASEKGGHPDGGGYERTGKTGNALDRVDRCGLHGLGPDDGILAGGVALRPPRPAGAGRRGPQGPARAGPQPDAEPYFRRTP